MGKQISVCNTFISSNSFTELSFASVLLSNWQRSVCVAVLMVQSASVVCASVIFFRNQIEPRGKDCGNLSNTVLFSENSLYTILLKLWEVIELISRDFKIKIKMGVENDNGIAAFQNWVKLHPSLPRNIGKYKGSSKENYCSSCM